MTVLFKNITKYTQEEMNRFQKFHNMKNKNKKMVWEISLAGLIISFFILNIVYRNWYAIIGILVITGILYTYYSYTNPKKKRQNNKSQISHEFTFEFSNKYVEIKSNKGGSRIPYRKFDKIYETKSNFYLYLDDEYSILINKNGFVIGNIDDFRDFIKKKLIFKYRLEK